MENKERNKRIVATEIAKEEFLKKTETAKEEFLRRLTDLGLSAKHVAETLTEMSCAIMEELEHRAEDIKLSAVVNDNGVIIRTPHRGAFGAYPYES